MKIRRVLKNGRRTYKVDFRLGGVRTRKFFANRRQAQNFAKRQRTTAKKGGTLVAAMNREQLLALEHQLNRIRSFNELHGAAYTLEDVLDHFEKTFTLPHAPTLADVIREFLDAKTLAGRSARYLKTLRVSLRAFSANLEHRKINGFTAGEIQEWLTGNGWGTHTMRTYLGDVRTLFGFAVRRRYCADNPARAVDLPTRENKPPGILTVEQCRSVLDKCVENEPKLLAVVAIMMLAGVRREEALRLTWSDIGENGINIEGTKAKTRQRRFVTVCQALREWLSAAQRLRAPLPPRNFQEHFKRLTRASGIENWPQNALRHSFASYHLARHGKEHETARELGNSPAMLFAHYRERVTPADAERFFNLFPARRKKVRARGGRDRAKQIPATPAVSPSPADEVVA